MSSTLVKMFNILWDNLEGSRIFKSDVHTFFCTVLIYFRVPLFFLCNLSAGYYISDLKYTKGLFFVHHIFAIYSLLLCSYYNLDIVRDFLIIERSVPFLNYYIKNPSSMRLVVFLLVHVYYRNIKLLGVVLDCDVDFNYFNLGLLYLFVIVNYWWTFKIIKKLL